MTAPPARADDAPAAAPSDAASEASSRFRRGIQLYKEGDPASALIEFRRAFELSPNYRVLFNMGHVYLDLHDYVRARDAFRRFLDGGGAEIAPDRRKSVEGEIAKLDGRIARLNIQCSEAGAEVSVDDEVVGQTPLDKPIFCNPGRHRVSVRKQGFEVTSRVVEVAATEAPVITLELAKIAEAPAPVAGVSPEALTKAAPEGHPSMTLTWVGVAATAAFAAGAVATGIVALDAKSQRDKALNTVPGDANRLSSLESQAKSFAIASDVLVGAAVVAGGLTVWSYLSARPSSPTAARLVPNVTRQGAGLDFFGSF